MSADRPQIEPAEFAERQRALQNASGTAGLDAVLVFSTESEPAGVRYFTDYWPSFETAGFLAGPDVPPVLLIGPESGAFSRSRAQVPSIVDLADFRESSMPDYPGRKLRTWRELLRTWGIRRLGVAGWHMFPQAIYAAIAEVIGAEAIVPADAVVRSLTLRKSPAELRCLREAARLSELGFRAALEQLRPGMTEIQLAGIAAAAMLAGGAEATGYPIWCCSGPNSNQAISRPTHRAVQRSEIIHFSVGAKVAGYSASVGRPVVIGPCPADVHALLQVGLDAQNLTIQRMRAGAAAAEVARQVHGYITERGFGDAILYGPAHGCGQMECEFPFVETSSTFSLAPEMVFMTDVFLARGQQGCRWEDGVIVRDGPAEELSRFGREITIL